MGMLDKIKSLWWRFPAKEDPPSEAGRFVLKTDAAQDATPKKKATITATDKTFYPKQRRYPRYPLQGMDIHAHMVITEEVDLQNISVNGACIHTKRHLQPGRTCLLKIRDEKMSRSIRCTAVWIRAIGSNDSMHKVYAAGLRFQNVASDEIVRLKDFMRNFGTPVETRVSDDLKPSPLRFSITTHTTAFLKCPKILNVRTISLGGMLLESDSAPEIENRYLMNLPLPHETEPIMIRGRIASILPRTDCSEPHFDVGVEFLAIEDADRARLDTFIHSL
jgi:Tfp pilus assembly protein PilZ